MAKSAPPGEATASAIKGTADVLDHDLPEMVAGDHLRDAATVLRSGNLLGSQPGALNGVKRHLGAAMQLLTPQELYRHGILDDDGHVSAKHHMHVIHRHLLAVQDMEDRARVRAALATVRAQRQPQPTAPGQPAPAQPKPQQPGGGGTLVPLPAPPGTPPSDSRRRPPPMQLDPGERAVMALSQLDHAIALAVGAPDIDNPAYYHPGEERGYHGRWIASGASGLHIPRPYGSFEHARMMDRYADTLEHPDARTAVHNATKAMIGRDIPTAIRHIEGAKWLDDNFMGGEHRADLDKIEASLNLVPPHAAIRNYPPNPLARRAQHPGTYRPIPGSVGSEPAAQPFRYGLATELSAQTPHLAATPAPYGRPGGPGLYNVKGLKHSDYFEQVVQALMKKRGMSKERASAVAWGALRRWRRGGQHAHPETRAASRAALAEEAAAGARARAQHHTAAGDAWDVAEVLIELAFSPAEMRGWHGRWAPGAVTVQQQQVPPQQAQRPPPQRKGGKQPGRAQQRAADRRGDVAAVRTISARIAALRNQLRYLRGQLAAINAKAAGTAASGTGPAAAGTAAAGQAAQAPAAAAAQTTPQQGGQSYAQFVAGVQGYYASQQASLQQQIAGIVGQIRALQRQRKVAALSSTGQRVIELQGWGGGALGGFNPSEQRGYHGRWAPGGAQAAPTATGWIPQPAWQVGQQQWEKAGEAAWQRAGEAERAEQPAQPPSFIKPEDLDARLAEHRQQIAAQMRTETAGQLQMHTEHVMNAVRQARETEQAVAANTAAEAERGKANLKLAIHAGAILAGAILALLTHGLGLALLPSLAAGLGPASISELVEWAKKL